MGAVGVATYGSWCVVGRVGTCRLYSVYSVGSECGGWRRGSGGLGGWIDVGVLGGE